MGYDVHITRANDWTESSLKAIDIEERKRLVDDDIEMDLTGVVYASTPSGQTLRYENEGLSIWKGKEGVCFDYQKGRIVVKIRMKKH